MSWDARGVPARGVAKYDVPRGSTFWIAASPHEAWPLVVCRRWRDHPRSNGLWVVFYCRSRLRGPRLERVLEVWIALEVDRAEKAFWGWIEVRGDHVSFFSRRQGIVVVHLVQVGWYASLVRM